MQHDWLERSRPPMLPTFATWTLFPSICWSRMEWFSATLLSHAGCSKYVEHEIRLLSLHEKGPGKYRRVVGTYYYSDKNIRILSRIRQLSGRQKELSRVRCIGRSFLSTKLINQSTLDLLFQTTRSHHRISVVVDYSSPASNTSSEAAADFTRNLFYCADRNSATSFTQLRNLTIVRSAGDNQAVSYH